MASTEIIRVVIIDDSKHSNHIIQATLDIVSDIEVVAIFDDYHTFDSTVQQCIELKPDVILIDASTHLFEYFKIFHRIIPASPVVCMSVSSAADLLQECLTLGLRFFIPKPFGKDQLNLIREIYEQYASIREKTYKFPDDD